MAKEFSLDEAREALHRTVSQLVNYDRAMSAADGADLTARVNAFADVFELDEWVRGTEQLDERICRWPLCFNAPRPPATTDEGMNKGGNRPRYCGGHDEGNPKTVPQRSARMRQSLRDRRAARSAARAAEPDAIDERTQPVTHARSQMTSLAEVITRGIGELISEFRSLQDLVARATDEQMVASEIEAARVAARQDVEREAAARIAAEQQTYEARTELNRIKADMSELLAAYAELEATAAEDRQARVEADARAVRAAQDAEDAIAAAEAEVERKLGLMNEQVKAAKDALAAALADIDDRERAAESKVAAATQRAKDAHEGHEEAKAELSRLTAENHRLLTAAIDREREVEAEFREMQVTHEGEKDSLRAAAGNLRTDLEEMRNKHEAAMEGLRIKHEETLVARLREAAIAADRIREAEVGQLKARIELLESQLSTAQPDVE